MEVKWIEEGYDAERGAYVIGYYVGDVRHCTFWGYLPGNSNVYKLRPRVIDPAGRAFPPVRDVSIFDVKYK